MGKVTQRPAVDAACRRISSRIKQKTNNYYVDAKRGIMWVIEVCEAGVWQIHASRGTRQRARDTVTSRQFHLYPSVSKVRIVPFKCNASKDNPPAGACLELFKYS